jgi:hypothetical protein
MKASQILALSEHLPFEAKIGDVVIVKGTFVPQVITGRMVSAMRQSISLTEKDMDPEQSIRISEEALSAQADVLALSIMTWDLQDESGDPMPITKESVAELPISIRNPIYMAIMESASPNETTA